MPHAESQVSDPYGADVLYSFVHEAGMLRYGHNGPGAGYDRRTGAGGFRNALQSVGSVFGCRDDQGNPCRGTPPQLCFDSQRHRNSGNGIPAPAVAAGGL